MPPTQKGGEGYNLPGGFENLDEVTVPIPLEENLQRRQPSFPETVDSREDRIRVVSDHSKGDGYDPREEYKNLNEVGVPSPIESPQIERPQGYLEDSRRRSRLEKSGGDPHQDVYPALNNEASSSSSSPTDLETPKPENPPSTPHRPNTSPFLIHLYTTSHLIFFSILGTLARLGLQALTTYPGAPVQTGVLWANVGGSFLLGFLLENRDRFSPHQEGPSSSSYQKTTTVVTPLYIGLSTGFCGSFTSFSSFIRDAFLALANRLPVLPGSHPSSAATSTTTALAIPRNGGYSFLALLAIILTTISLSLSALFTGAHLALALKRHIPSPSISHHRAAKPSPSLLNPLILLLAWTSWAGAVIMAIHPPPHYSTWRTSPLFACVFAPLGTLTRFHISLLLNTRIPTFPLGTFTINILGTALEGAFWDLQHALPPGGGGKVVGCQVLQGLADGFCGCATTVSTFVAEIRGLKGRGRAWGYGAGSVVGAVGVMVVVMGPGVWGRGWEDRRVGCTVVSR
ncbi:MAG: hypothetical protein Q9219_006642 [cf. Caloplaca sp. 3 TL-2023]